MMCLIAREVVVLGQKMEKLLFSVSFPLAGSSL